MSHVIWNPQQGFTQHNGVAETKIFRVNVIHKDGLNIPKSVIYHELALELSHEIIAAKVIRVSTQQNAYDYSLQYTAELTACSPGTKFTNVRNDVFTINNEHFNEQDIIEALKLTFPERFL